MPWVARKWRRLYEAARKDRREDRFWSDVSESIREGNHGPSDFSIRDIFENFVESGYELIQSWSPRSGGTRHGINLVEAGVDTSAFANITGQIMYSRVLDAFQDPVFLADQLVTTVPTQFSGEKIPGISRIGDEAESIGESEPYPLAGVSEEWIETPETTKRGFIVPVTKEALFFDRTGLVLQRASEVSTWLAINKEKRVLDVVLGITDLYRRNGSAAIATYGDNSGSHDWDNLAATNALVDWTDIENAELLFDGLTDPNTGEPIVVMPDTIIVPTALKHTAKRVVSATEIQHVDNQANAATIRTSSTNPLANYSIVSSQFVKARTNSATTWFLGQPRAAFWYMENWPITVTQAPANSEAEFSQDIVQRYKVSERGTAAVIEPRRMVKCTA